MTSETPTRPLGMHGTPIPTLGEMVADTDPPPTGNTTTVDRVAVAISEAIWGNATAGPVSRKAARAALAVAAGTVPSPRSAEAAYMDALERIGADPEVIAAASGDRPAEPERRWCQVCGLGPLADVHEGEGDPMDGLHDYAPAAGAAGVQPEPEPGGS